MKTAAKIGCLLFLIILLLLLPQWITGVFANEAKITNSPTNYFTPAVLDKVVYINNPSSEIIGDERLYSFNLATGKESMIKPVFYNPPSPGFWPLYTIIEPSMYGDKMTFSVLGGELIYRPIRLRNLLLRF